jgi:endonuclease YncB( thermonuclease family)
MLKPRLFGPKRLVAVLFILLLIVFRTVSWWATHGHRETFPPIPPRTDTPSTALEGLVESVADGDTLTLLDANQSAHRIRLLGIDAPESRQRFGHDAKQALAALVSSRRVSVLVQSTDRYGRTVGKVLCDGADINLEMVREGCAWHYKHYAADQFPGDADRYAEAEQEARKQHRGLWRDEAPLEPWVWREQHPRS